MKLMTYKSDGTQAGEQDFAIPEFEGDKGRQALKQVILAHLANKRQGTKLVKNRGTVHGTGKKPFRQKGTGRARQGAMNRVQHYHGAVVHGPKRQDWTQKINRKMRQLALRRALFERAVDGEVGVIEKFEFEQPKTRLFNAVLKNIQPEGKILAVDDGWSDVTLLAGRNLERLSFSRAADLCALDLAKYDKIVFTSRGMEKVLARAATE